MIQYMRQLLKWAPELKGKFLVAAIYKVFETLCMGAPYAFIFLTLNDLLAQSLSIKKVVWYTGGMAICFLSQGVFSYLFTRTIWPTANYMVKKLSLISMIPNVFPVIITLGVMGFAGINLDMPLMCCSAIIIGVAVDDTIHFFRRYRREFAASGSYSQALGSSLGTVGRPITFTTMTLILGFGVMMLSDISGRRNSFQ